MKGWMYFVGSCALFDLSRLLQSYLGHYEPHGLWETFDWWLHAFSVFGYSIVATILLVLAFKSIIGKEE